MVYSIQEIKEKVVQIALRYPIEAVYLFGSYARGEATQESDLDFLVIWKPGERKTFVFAFAEDLRETFQKKVDAFELSEINQGTKFHENIMKDGLRVA